jgi:hypothetical protein
MARFVFEDAVPAAAAPAARFVFEDTPATAQSGPSNLTAFGRGAAQGATLGFADEFGGMAKAGVRVAGDVRTPGPKALAKMYPGVPYPEAAARWFDANRPDVKAAGAAEEARIAQGASYESERDKIREADRAAREAHPVAFGAGEFTGAAATAPLMSVAAPARAATLTTRVAQGALSAAPVGAVFGLGASESKDVGGQMLDAFTGAGTAAGLGAALPVVGEGVRKVAAPIARRLSQTAIEQGQKALSGVSSALSARKQIPASVVQQALDTGAIKPLGTVAGTAERLATQADELGGAYADILAGLEAKGVHGPEAEALAAELSKRAVRASDTSLNSPRPGMLQSTADELLTKPIPISGKGRLGLMQSEEMKRGLQAEAAREYDKITRQYTTAGETKKEIAAAMRGAIEDAVQQQAALAPEEAAAFEPVKAKLANALAALRVAEEGAARAARRKPISLTSTIAGSAIGAGSGNPLLGLLGALGHGAVDSRLASTLARAANTGSKGANALARMSVPPSAARAAAVGLDPELAALISVLRGRPGFAPAAAEEADQ